MPDLTDEQRSQFVEKLTELSESAKSGAFHLMHANASVSSFNWGALITILINILQTIQPVLAPVLHEEEPVQDPLP